MDLEPAADLAWVPASVWAGLPARRELNESARIPPEPRAGDVRMLAAPTVGGGVNGSIAVPDDRT